MSLYSIQRVNRPLDFRHVLLDNELAEMIWKILFNDTQMQLVSLFPKACNYSKFITH
jgi:hypothetical protein